VTYTGCAPVRGCRRRRSSSTAIEADHTTGLTVFGCTREEAALFRVLSPGLGVLPTMTDAGLSESNAELARGDRCVSVGHKTQVTDSMLRALSRAGVEYLSTRSAGRDHIDAAYAESVGICVEGVAYSPDSVADYTLMLMLMALRQTKSVLARAAVHDYRLSRTRGRELGDLTVGVIGTGRIGSAVVDRLRGFGCRVLTHDSHPLDLSTHVPLDELLQQCDLVTLHTPLTAETHHLLDRRRIKLMKHGGVVVNTGRGALLDTEALVSALEDGRVGGAALDVLEGEEGIFYADLRTRTVESDLLLRLQSMPNVLITPHLAYYTDHALADIVEHTLTSCLNFESRNCRG
jgi:D-specific alpha-keto acid dehydrogenase